MGVSGSSSRRKPSKRKRKYDRVSSQKKRSGKKESRKRRQRCDFDSLNSGHNKNLSTSSDDQSMCSDSDSVSAYDRRHKHRRARQSRLSLKSTKKRRERKRFATNSESDADNLRKSTRLRRDVKTRKKSSEKKSRKHLSSSSSYDSESCSTCQSGSSLDSKHLKSEAIIDKEKKRARGRESHRAHKRRRTRSPSYSSHSSSSNQSVGVSHGGGAFPPVNPRRLRSVIAIADQSCNEETNRWEMDPQKEEIVYDKEDYPSPRSLDSNEHTTKMESGNDYHDLLSNIASVEDIAVEKASETVYVGDHQQSHENNVVVKDNDVSVPAAASDDLESILRQKALENLRKFRGELPSLSLKTKSNGSDVNVMATQEANNELAEEGSSDVQVTNQCGPSSKRDSEHLVEVQKFPEDKHIEKEYGMIEQNAVSPRDGPPHLGCSEDDKGTSSQTDLLPRGGINTGAVATIASGSPVNPTASVGIFTGDNSLHTENETKDGSQFEQRTMSVMRGGEMVQVSYKVYIPKTTPALARRQFKR